MSNKNQPRLENGDIKQRSLSFSTVKRERERGKKIFAVALRNHVTGGKYPALRQWREARVEDTGRAAGLVIFHVAWPAPNVGVRKFIERVDNARS